MKQIGDGRTSARVQAYPGRASMSPLLDVLVTLLHWGASGWCAALAAREDLFGYAQQRLGSFAARAGERLLHTPGNPISLALTLDSLGDASDPNPNLNNNPKSDIEEGVSGEDGGARAPQAARGGGGGSGGCGSSKATGFVEPGGSRGGDARASGRGSGIEVGELGRAAAGSTSGGAQAAEPLGQIESIQVRAGAGAGLGSGGTLVTESASQDPAACSARLGTRALSAGRGATGVPSSSRGASSDAGHMREAELADSAGQATCGANVMGDAAGRAHSGACERASDRLPLERDWQARPLGSGESGAPGTGAAPHAVPQEGSQEGGEPGGQAGGVRAAESNHEPGYQRASQGPPPVAFLGSMLFKRCVSGTRVVARGKAAQVAGPTLNLPLNPTLPRQLLFRL